MGTKLERIMEISATTPKPEFTSLYHLINIEMLKQCHKELDGSKAVGIDKVTKAEYEEHLEENLTNINYKIKIHSFYLVIYTCRSNFADKEITAEKLLIQAGFRIPNSTEFESVNFVGDIPGNTKEVDEVLKKKRIIYLKESIVEDESKIAMYEKKREILEPVLRSLQYDIEQCSSRVKYANQRIEQARKELIGLQTN